MSSISVIVQQLGLPTGVHAMKPDMGGANIFKGNEGGKASPDDDTTVDDSSSSDDVSACSSGSVTQYNKIGLQVENFSNKPPPETASGFQCTRRDALRELGDDVLSKIPHRLGRQKKGFKNRVQKSTLETQAPSPMTKQRQPKQNTFEKMNTMVPEAVFAIPKCLVAEKKQEIRRMFCHQVARNASVDAPVKIFPLSTINEKSSLNESEALEYWAKLTQQKPGKLDLSLPVKKRPILGLPMISQECDPTHPIKVPLPDFLRHIPVASSLFEMTGVF